MRQGDRVKSPKFGGGVIIKKYIDNSVLVYFDSGVKKKSRPDEIVKN